MQAAFDAYLFRLGDDIDWVVPLSADFTAMIVVLTKFAKFKLTMCSFAV